MKGDKIFMPNFLQSLPTLKVFSVLHRLIWLPNILQSFPTLKIFSVLHWLIWSLLHLIARVYGLVQGR